MLSIDGVDKEKLGVGIEFSSQAGPRVRTVDRYALRGKAGAEDGAMGLYKAGLYVTCLELSQVLGI